MGNGLGLALGMEAGKAVINAGIQQGQNAMNSRRQYKYNIKSMREAADIENRQTEFNMGLQKDMWDYTNVENQAKHIENAGLNKALLYGMSGSGGTTAAVQTGSGKGSTVSQGGTSAGMGIDSIQAALLKAQKDNLDADTEKKRAEAWGQDLNNAWEHWMQTNNPDNAPADGTVENSMKARMTLQDLIGKEFQNKLTAADIKVDEGQINKMVQDIIQRAQEIALEGRAVSVSELLAKFNTDWKNIIGKEALETIGGVIKMLPLGRILGGKTPNVIKGFGGKR